MKESAVELHGTHQDSYFDFERMYLFVLLHTALSCEGYKCYRAPKMTFKSVIYSTLSLILFIITYFEQEVVVL